MKRPVIIWDYNSRPAPRDECSPLVSIELPDHTEATLLFNSTTQRIHISHDDNWGYIDYVEEDKKAQ